MFKKGAALRYPILDAKGALLLAQGTLVNDRLREVLQVRGISLEIQASLTSLKGGQVGLEIPIDKSLFRIGRRPECDLRLASHVVSGCHCRIVKTRLEVLLSDLESSNGTYLNGRCLTQETELQDNDQIRVGPFVFRIRIYAALAAESNDGAIALKSWLLEETTPNRKPTSYQCRTEPEIDLDANP